MVERGRGPVTVSTGIGTIIFFRRIVVQRVSFPPLRPLPLGLYLTHTHLAHIRIIIIIPSSFLIQLDLKLRLLDRSLSVVGSCQPIPSTT